MDKEYYKEYYNIERNHWWFKARSEILNNYIRSRIVKDKNVSILNVGVATGASSVMLQKFGEVTSLEYEQECIDFIKDKVPINVIQGSILDLPFPDNTFDLVCAFDVIEHVEEDVLAVSELKRVCKSNGSVLITVPAFMSLWGEHDLINHHFRRYSLGLLQKIFQGESGVIALATYFNFFLFPPILLVRKISGIFDKRKEILNSDFQKYNAGIVNYLLFCLMKSESFFIKRGLRFPWGVSAMLHWKKRFSR